MFGYNYVINIFEWFILILLAFNFSSHKNNYFIFILKEGILSFNSGLTNPNEATIEYRILTP